MGAMEPLLCSSQRSTHTTLPKLTIRPYKGPKPLEIPLSQVGIFIDTMERNRQEPVTLIPLPVFPAPPTRKPRAFRQRSNTQEIDEQDPYLVNLPTPTTIQFTKNDAIELAQWREITGALSEAHAEVLDQLMDDPTDANLRKQVRALRAEREKNLKEIEKVSERRQIRKNFRKDFNNLLPGW